MESTKAMRLDEQGDLLRLYDTAIERQKKLVHHATIGKHSYTEINQEKLIALTKSDLKILSKARQGILKDIEKIKAEKEPGEISK